MIHGEVVLVDWAYSDSTGTKLRPAIVVQADFLNTVIDDTILVQITGRRHGLPGTEVEIDPAQEPRSGLTKVSYANCTNLLTTEQALIDQTIGYVADAVMQRIGQCLKTVLELP